MLYRYPSNSFAVVRVDYLAPYVDPIAVVEGDIVVPDNERTKETDFLGWTWCSGPDGRQGWVPDTWMELRSGAWTMLRDFAALELSVVKGERITLEFSESGFVFGRTDDGRSGWLPDAILQLVS